MEIHTEEKTSPTIVFDLDGTLVDSARDLVPTLNRVIEREGLPAISMDHVGHLVGHGALKMIDRAYKFHGRTLDREKRGELHQRFLELYENNLANETILFEGVLNVLDTLKSRHWAMAVCTNKYEAMSKKLLKELEVDHYFEAICGSDTFPMRKPDPAHLTKTIELVGGNTKNSVMIGDSITDIQTAHAADIPVIAVTFGYSEHPVEQLNPSKVVSHYKNMLCAIEEVVGKVPGHT